MVNCPTIIRGLQVATVNELFKDPDDPLINALLIVLMKRVSSGTICPACKAFRFLP